MTHWSFYMLLEWQVSLRGLLVVFAVPESTLVLAASLVITHVIAPAGGAVYSPQTLFVCVLGGWVRVPLCCPEALVISEI